MFSRSQNGRDFLENIPQGKFLVESDPEILHKCIECGVDAVEIHTGDYARDHLRRPVELIYRIIYTDIK